MRSRTLCFALAVFAGLVVGVACSAANNGRGTAAGSGGSGAGVSSSGAGGKGQGGTSVSSSTSTGLGGTCAPATISGTVYDPAGKLPLYGVYVYIPSTTPDAITPGHPTCTACQVPASGNPIIGTLTDANGHFTLAQSSTSPPVPMGDHLTLVLQAGKWRRQISLPHIGCGATALPDPATPSAKLRLPAKSSEGDMPLIALTSGCDPAECFLRHVGIDDSEFVPPGSTTGHVHFYTGIDVDNVDGGQVASSIKNGNTPAETYAWWTKASNLMQYDIVFASCECAPNDRNKALTTDAGPDDAYAAMDAYLKAGGRLFATHFQYNWFAPKTGPTDLEGVADWNLPELLNPMYSTYFVDTTFPKGKAFADWAQAQGVSTTYGQIDVIDTRWDVNHVLGQTSRWIYNANTPDNTTYATMYMSFNTPVGVPAAMQCGRAVYSDVHLSGTSDDTQFPNECVNPDKGFSTPHTINEKALEFLFFDLSSCVQDNSEPPVIPPPTK